MRFSRRTAWAASAVLAGVLVGILSWAAPAAALDGPSVRTPIVAVDPTTGLHVVVPLPTLPVTTPVPTGGSVTVDGNRNGLHVGLPGGEIGLNPPPLPPLPVPPAPVLPVLPVQPPAPAPPSGSTPTGADAPAGATVAPRVPAVVVHPAPGASHVATPPGAVKPTNPAVRVLPAGARGAVVTTTTPGGSSSLWSAPLRHLGLWLALTGLALIMRAVIASAWRDRAGALSPR